eukprot:43236-Eustigmatos_ZCMA.PRE.1
MRIDSGSTIRDGVKCMGGRGACSEKLYAYDVLLWANEPPPECTAEAFKNRAKIYARVSKNQHDLESCLAAGVPVVFGFFVYESFTDPNGVAKTGIMTMPDTKKEAKLGGHAVVLVGFNRYKRQFLVRNSWGLKFGVRGYIYMPYELLLSDMTFDFWSMSMVSTPPPGASITRH